jgi:hypothetical protein
MPSRLLPWAGAAAALLVLSVGSDWFDRAWRYPWSNAASGRPTLTGQWVGALATGSGRPRGVFLELERDIPEPRRRCRGCSTIKGRALTCDEGGREQRYRVTGNPDDRRATRLHLGTIPTADPPPDGLELGTLVGRWDGDGLLALAAEFHWRKGTSAISGTDDPDTGVDAPVRLRRGSETEFRAACRTLPGAAGRK